MQPGYEPVRGSLEQWGLETCRALLTAFSLGEAGELSEHAPPDDPCFLWPLSTALGALLAPSTPEWMLNTDPALSFLNRYWVDTRGIGGFAVLPDGRSHERYYDDNGWIALRLLQAFREQNWRYTNWQWLFDRLVATVRFCLSGHDGELGGGIWWKEEPHESKNACSTLSTAVACLRLAKLSLPAGMPDFAEHGRTLTTWVTKTLQDADGLVMDNIRRDGTLDRAKYSYNTAMLIEAHLELHELLYRSSQSQHLDEAIRIAHAAEREWVNPATGLLRGDLVFAAMLVEAFIHLGNAHPAEQDHWWGLCRRAAYALYTQVRSANGFYPKHWDDQSRGYLARADLQPTAAAARSYLIVGDAVELSERHNWGD